MLEKAKSEGPQKISKDGRTTAVVVAAEEWERKAKRKGTLEPSHLGLDKRVLHSNYAGTDSPFDLSASFGFQSSKLCAPPFMRFLIKFVHTNLITRASL